MKLYKIKKSKIDNNGLYANQNIKKGTKIIEYKGKIISVKQSEVSSKFDNGKAIYLFNINKKYDLDGDFKFNTARLINHSCDPNCEVDGTGYKIYITAIKDIRKNGKKALLKYEKKFSKNTEIVPSKDKVNKAIRALDPKIKKSIDLAYNRIFKFHSLQKPKDIKYVDNLKNKLEYKHVPLQSVGIYVPANLPSTLLMNAVPAKISGVKRIVLANPKLDGKLNPAVLYAAKKVGIKEIYSMGGAQAIESLA